MSALFLERVYRRPEASLSAAIFPGTLPFLADLDLPFTAAITFFVGENGSGKSTLIEAIAELCDLPVTGGGRNELGDSEWAATSDLAAYVRAGFRTRPKDGYFFRAEFQARFADLLERRRADPGFKGNPYARYGGRSLHQRSHGEAFLAMFSTWMRPGIILMDEPEAALSPQRQLVLLTQMARLVQGAGVQFIIATHSPVLMTFPAASLLSFDGAAIEPVQLEDTPHYHITKGILDNPERYWHHLLREDEGEEA